MHREYHTFLTHRTSPAAPFSKGERNVVSTLRMRWKVSHSVDPSPLTVAAIIVNRWLAPAACATAQGLSQSGCFEITSNLASC
jgi:hypothetical protein